MLWGIADFPGRVPRGSCGILVLFLCVCVCVQGRERTGRLVISSRQFTPGTSGVGEVVRVDEHEFEKLVREQGVTVVKGSVAEIGNVTSGTNGTMGDVVVGEEVRHAGVPDVADLKGDVTTTTTSTSTTGATSSENPIVVAANPEDSSRGTSQTIDRRKVVNKDQGPGGDLSFTGILNGLLDSFINEPGSAPPSPQQSRPRPSSSQPSAEDVEEEEEEDADVDMDLEQSPEETKDSGKSSVSVSPPSTTEELSAENVSEEPIEDDEDADQDYVVPQNNTKVMKKCEGECRNIIFGLFLCDEIDNDAFCAESGLACCVNNPEPEYNRYRPVNGSSEEDVHLDNEHDKPIVLEESNEDVIEEEEEEVPQKSTSSEQKQVPSPAPPPQQRFPSYGNRPPPHYSNQPPPPQYYYPPPNKNTGMMMHRPPPPPMPLACPRYCVKNYHENHCSERLPSQFACGMDAFCCSHPVNPVKEQPAEQPSDDDEDTDLYRNEDSPSEDPDPEDTTPIKKIIGPCTEDVGSCVSKNIINIICFGHAQPTDFYTCPRSTMKCCARKTALPKDSIPSTTLPPPPKLENTITRNSSSLFPKPQHSIPPGPPQILPQFAPKLPPPQYHVPAVPFVPPPTNTPSVPQLAETPPPPITQNIGIPATQFTNPFSTQSRVPARQPVGQYVCGVKGVPTVSKRRRKRVVGGSDSLPGEWCWQVALINSLNQYLCGGALIGTQWVLTAAHCVTNIVRSGDAIYVRVGDHDLTSRYGSPGAQTLRVATTYIHHNHNSQTLDNDIALLKLQGNAALKEGVCLICLPSRNHLSEVPGKRCTVTGYGYTSESGPIPLRIREAVIPIVSDDECVRNVNAVTEKVFALPMSSFCAGGDDSGNDACQGDGGGPLVCRSDDTGNGDSGTGYYELTGLVSWGFGCSRSRVPGVYVKVSSFIGWIHQIIRSN